MQDDESPEGNDALFQKSPTIDLQLHCSNHVLLGALESH